MNMFSFLNTFVFIFDCKNNYCYGTNFYVLQHLYNIFLEYIFTVINFFIHLY